jgi:hypothetical protein
MNLPMDKIMNVINLVKGKKPVVIIISVVAIGLGLFAVSKGYIPESVVDVNTIINYIDGAFGETAKAVDTIATQVVVDSISNGN